MYKTIILNEINIFDIIFLKCYLRCTLSYIPLNSENCFLE